MLLILSYHFQSQAVTSPPHATAAATAAAAAAMLPRDKVRAAAPRERGKKKNSGRVAEGRPIAVTWELAM